MLQYNRNNVEVGAFRRGGLFCGENAELNAVFPANISAPLNRPKIFFYSVTVESFNTKKTL